MKFIDPNKKLSKRRSGFMKRLRCIATFGEIYLLLWIYVVMVLALLPVEIVACLLAHLVELGESAQEAILARRDALARRLAHGELR